MSATKPRSRTQPSSVINLSPWQQQQAAAIIQSARQEALNLDPDIAGDPQLWLDTLDGETNAIDLIRAYITEAINAEMLAELTAQRKAEITARAARAERRKLACRAVALQLMQIAGVPKVPDAEFSARVQPGQQYLDELDVAALPDEYVEIAIIRTPLKDRILRELRSGASILGAALKPAVPFLVINRA